MEKHTFELPDIPVEGTSVTLTNVQVTVESMLPADVVQMAVLDWFVRTHPPE